MTTATVSVPYQDINSASTIANLQLALSIIPDRGKISPTTADNALLLGSSNSYSSLHYCLYDYGQALACGATIDIGKSPMDIYNGHSAGMQALLYTGPPTAAQEEWEIRDKAVRYLNCLYNECPL